jgi:hypothetical protein
VRCLTRSKLLLQGYNTAREASVSKMRGRAESTRPKIRTPSSEFLVASLGVIMGTCSSLTSCIRLR